MSVDDLRNRAVAEGERVSKGRFKVDAVRALAKLRDHRLADPHHYVLELVRAAIASGAANIAIRNDANDLELTFDGASIPPEVLRDLFGHALTGGKDDDAVRFRLLALGVNGALALRPSYVLVRSGTLELRVRPPDLLAVTDLAAAQPGDAGGAKPGAKPRPDKANAKAKAKPKPTTPAGTFIHVRERVSWRVVKNAVTGAPEARVIAAYARHCSAQLTLNGKRLDGPVTLDGMLVQRTWQSGGRRLVAGVPLSPAAETELTLDVLGVKVTTRRLTLPGLQLVAWARGDDLRRNASASDIVDDDPAYAALLDELNAMATRLAKDLVQQLGDPEETANVHAHLRAALRRVIAAPTNVPADLAKVLKKAPLLPGPSGESLSFAVLDAERVAGRAIKVAYARYARALYDPPVVYLGGADREALEALLPGGPRHDIAQQAAARAEREENKRRFQARSKELPRLLEASQHALRVPLDGVDGLEGEIGLLVAGESTQVRVLHQGRLLDHREMPALRPLRVHVILQSSRLAPNAAWTGVDDGAALTKILNAVRKTAEGAILAALAAPNLRLDEPLRRHALDLLCALGGRNERVPDALDRAPLFDVVGGARLSLEKIRQLPEVRHVAGLWSDKPLDARLPILALPRARDRETLQRFVSRPFLVWDGVLEAEARIRARMADREEPTLTPGTSIAETPIEGEGLRGALGLPLTGVAPALELRLLRDGVILEQVKLRARYAGLHGIVDCPELTPNDTWSAARPDAVHARVLDAVRTAERRLLPALLAALPRQTRDDMPLGARDFVSEFLRAELGSPGARENPDAEQRAALDAPLFRGAHGPVSLAAIDAAGRARGKILFMTDGRSYAPVPKDWVVVVGDQATEHLLHKLFDIIYDAAPELARERQRAEFHARPEREPVAPEIALRVAITGRGLRGEIGYQPSGVGGPLIDVLYRRRTVTRYAHTYPLPLCGILEVLEPPLDPTSELLPELVEFAIDQTLQAAERLLLLAVLENPARPGARELLLATLAAQRDTELPSAMAVRLTGIPVFPMRDGRVLAEDVFAAAPRVLYTTDPVAGLPATGEPVIVASEAAVRAAVSRWRAKAIDVTTTLQAARAREQLAPVARVEITGEVLLRRRFAADGLEGEVAFVPGEEPTNITVYQRRRPAGTQRLAGPMGVTAVVDLADAAVEAAPREGAPAEVVRRVEAELELLAADLACSWGTLPETQRDALTSSAARVVCWLLARQRVDSPAMALPVLRTTAGGPLSGAMLLAREEEAGNVPYAEAEGALLEPGAWVWRPRIRELALIAGAPLHLNDVRQMVERAAEVRARPRHEVLTAPLVGPWREPVLGDGIVGEVALSTEAPLRRLTIELLRDRRLVERVSVRHLVGGVAQVNCDALTPDAAWATVARDAAFQAVVAAIDAALERVLARYLDSTRADARALREYVVAAARWALQGAGPVAQRLRQLPLFMSVQGADVTLGAVLAEVAQRGQLAVASVDLRGSAGGELVLAVGEDQRKLLEELGIGPLHDVTAVVEQENALVARQASQRVGLRHAGAALVRLAVDSEGWRGELCLPLVPDGAGQIVLARAETAVSRHAAGRLGVVGVLSHAALPVDTGWTEARLAASDLQQIDGFVAQLFARLAVEVAGYDDIHRGLAARHMLRWLHHLGVTSPGHLDNMALPPAANTLAQAKLLRTADGRWVDLRAVADRALRRGRVPLTIFAVDAADAEGDLVLRVTGADDPAGHELAAVLVDRLEWIRDREAWKRWLAERDPADDTPLGRGLALLRREADLLRAVACGRLEPKELRDVRFQRAGGKRAVGYDAARGVAVLDPEHADVRRTLEEAQARPDRLYVLLVAIYGAINRALDRVTDADEARLATALLAHLAANPQLLGE